MSILRKALLKYQTKSESDRIPLVLTYHPYLRPTSKIAKNLQPLLNKDPYLNKILPASPLISYRQPPDLKLYLHLPLYQINLSLQISQMLYLSQHKY